MLQTAVLAFSLSTDAFAASIAKGAKHPETSARRKFFIAASFGLAEAIAPFVGFLLGQQFESYIEDFDHWIAFGLLALLGARMIWKSLHPEDEVEGPVNPSWAAVAITAAGTSIDATAVGLTLALISNNIPLTLLVIGLMTFSMTFIGLHLGGRIGERFGRKIEFAGGLGLVLIGLNILRQHLS